MQGKNSIHDPFLALADPTRRNILYLLNGRELSIKGIADNFTLSRTAVIKHLVILSDAGLVKKRKKGRESLFILEKQPLQKVVDWIGYFDLYWDEQLRNLKDAVEGKR
jgi:DNA-binding transcriptional ArsR family regulator